MVLPFTIASQRSLRENAAMVRFLLSVGDYIMSEGKVHIKDSGSSSLCGVKLLTCSYDPAMFVLRYDPEGGRHSILRIVFEDTSYPIFEQVCVSSEIDMCSECLSWFGISLLNRISRSCNSMVTYNV